MERPDAGQRTFLEKWHDQLLGESADVHSVAVELVAFYQLFPTNIGKQAKLKELNTIAGWKLSQDKPDLGVLHQAFENGLGNPGTQYLTGKPWHIAFYLQFAMRIIAEKIDPLNAEVCKLIANEVRTKVPQSGAARHIVLHLLFPDQFERIASETQRRRIVQTFSTEAGGASDQDDALFNIRKALQKQFQRETIDFYDKDIWPLWDKEGAEPVQFWIEKTHVRGRSDREEGPYALGNALWSPKQHKGGGDIYKFMRQVRPGDVVFHLTDSEAITAVSWIESKFEEFEGVADTEWGLGPSYLVRLRDSLQIIPALSRDTFFSPPFRERLLGLIDSNTKNLFYNRELSLNQGAYLTPAPPELVRILSAAYESASGKSLADLIPEVRGLTTSSTVAGAWIFQANPDLYDIKSALQTLTEQTWLVTKFKEEIKVGDKVYLWQSGSEGGIVGLGEITAPPQMGAALEAEGPFAKSSGKFDGEHLRATLRISKVIDPPIMRKALLARPELSELTLFRQPQGTNYRVTKTEAQALDALINGSVIQEITPAVSIADLEAVTNLPSGELKEIEALLRYKKQIIFEGPPGAGKTYVAELFARYFSGNTLDVSPKRNLLTIQFHQSFGYEDFIQGIRPETTIGGQLTYRVKQGVFKTFCDEARGGSKPFVVVIDEINRGNISRIFGELLYLLEYREKQVMLPYDGKPFSIPPNVYIIGTMNTTDRSLAQIDYALRRRFFFYRLMPVVNGEAPVLERALEKLNVNRGARDQVVRLFVSLNNRIQGRLGEHFQIGHSHFIRPDIADDYILSQIWNRSIVPLLEEYFYNLRDRASVLAEFTVEKLLSDNSNQNSDS
jgi:MoxR-like ATPase/predicted RNA-binding protein with PUA-like domain